MEFLLIIIALVLGAVFSFNAKSTAAILCKVAGGFAFLLIYNSIAPRIGLPSVGINIISSAVCGILGVPGGLLLICLNL
ncbi:MAG: hypothetical protein E7406_08610 [Ruminococcaceae bacterium]|nr:hypothetical protein [Oscillospiraceae bacterium]